MVGPDMHGLDEIAAPVDQAGDLAIDLRNREFRPVPVDIAPANVGREVSLI
ncbi:hypothetical protein ACVDG5_029415 [Mesorhizobium sp. ORM6]